MKPFACLCLLTLTLVSAPAQAFECAESAEATRTQVENSPLPSSESVAAVINYHAKAVQTLHQISQSDAYSAGTKIGLLAALQTLIAGAVVIVDRNVCTFGSHTNIYLRVHTGLVIELPVELKATGNIR